jgi:phage terminase large subunit
MKIEDYFIITQDSIRSRYGAEIIFRGLRNNITEIKSLEGVSIAWIEEAEKVSQESLDLLVPTIREKGSEIWVSFNPESEHSPVYKRFVKQQRPDTITGFINWFDNDFFPEVLKKELEYDRRVDYEKYLHIWEGQVKQYSDVCIFKNKITVEEFETPEDIQLYFGADWGFSNDPTVLVRMFIQDTKLFIDYEFYAVGIEITELERAFDTVPESRTWTIRADSERPDTISYMRQRGFNIVGAEKGKGSVEDGIQFLRSFEQIVIHPRCRGAIDNFLNYRWKQDRITQEVLPIPADGSDHVPDSARYALEPYIKAKEPMISWI